MQHRSTINTIFGRLRTVIDSIYNGVVAINTGGKVIVCNKSAQKLIAKPMKEIIGSHILDIIPESGLMEVLETGQPVVGEKMKINDTVVYTNRTPLWDDGEIIGAVGVFQDISQIEKISRRLSSVQRLSRELENVIESSADGIYITDGRGVTTRVNSAYERITGIKREEVLGRHMRDLEEKGLISQSGTLMVLEKKRPVTILQQIRNSKTVMITSTPYFNEDGEISMVITNVRDMTKLKALEQELEKSRALTERYQRQIKEMKLQQLQSDDVVIQSPAMLKVYETALRAAKFDSTVLLLGESGVGKEVVARLIHQNSNRSEGPYIKVNCGAIPENLLESELFGYEGGAFTGSRKEGKCGLFELADGGTLLLDEIGELPLELQVKLLRVLQDKEFKPVGGTSYKKVDVRVIAATNKDLEREMQSGSFRRDLYYRLNVIPISIPPLRERPEDILALIEHFLKRLNTRYGVSKKISSRAMKLLYNYHWPGNVRELENLIEHLFIMCDQAVIDADHLPDYLKEHRQQSAFEEIAVNGIVPLKEAKRIVEEKLIDMALKQAGSVRAAAKLLGVDHSTLVKKRRR